ncbi:S8 family serine peptidase [Kordia sp. SMS9]|uniref:S8 family serine peptidase n=1 Tax=Kordia sp. SMS9 TaxID=2282170 RepID=UPI000E0DD668|nr:S8 family serine peptidase [Kordia sp. SMS9]
MKKITLAKRFAGSFIPLLVALLLLNTTFLTAQNTVYFQDEVITMPNNISTFTWNSMPESAKLDGGYFAWVRFSETPVQAIQNDFAQRNLRLIEYYPDKTYLVHVPENTEVSYLQEAGIISVIPVDNNVKKSSQIKLNNIDDHAMEGNSMVVMLEYHDFIDKSYIKRTLSNINAVIIKEDYSSSNYLQVAIPTSQVDAVVSKPFVKWIELIPPPAILEDVRGRSIHRSSNLDSQTPTGRNYTGEGVGLLVRDDGVVGPHIDFQGRLNTVTTANTGTHGDGVSGIMTGAGNLNPSFRGMAAGSDVYVTTIAVSFLDGPTVDLFNDGTVQISNNSYGTTCNGGYTSAARTVDTQISTIPSALHVFSAGNSGGSNCGYGAGAGWGNITGGAKQGKNGIAVANTFFNGSLANSSSRGPAYDGRIKPDIAAHGQEQVSTTGNNGYQTFGGTSGAAPGIAGVAAQLYEAYALLNGGNLPDSGLIKAAMLNTANDYGNTGPDYRFGWGMVNALRAAMLIEDGRYLDATVTQGNSNNHSITVPANTREVRFMVYWDDVPAAAGATSALVNDLDLLVTDPNSTTYQPWILDSSPIASFLNFPAAPGTDRLNNMEQVAITNPTAGTYTINVNGLNVPFGPQKYHVVYEIITDGITLTYPIGGEKLTSGASTVIHWDFNNLANSTTVLEFSGDNGASWSSIVSLASSARNFTWSIPSNLTSGECMIRVTNGSFSSQSPVAFSVAPQATGVAISQICPDGVTLSWNAVSGASSYDIYLLGEKYMEVAANTTATSMTVPVPNPLDPVWVAVSAKGGNGWESLRTNAINVNGGGLFNCPLAQDLAVTTINNIEDDFNILCNTAPIIISAALQNDGTDAQSNFTVSYQIGSGTVVQETFTNTLASGANTVYNFTTPATVTANGDTTLRVWTSLTGDQFLINDEQTLDFRALVSGTTIDFLEDLNASTALPQDWTITNPDSQTTWQISQNIVGADGNPSNAFFIDGYNYNNAGGALDTFTTEYFNTIVNPDATLLFNISKAQYGPGFSDGLRVEVSTDCGVSFTEVYFKDGGNLATVPNTTNLWEPTDASHWREEIVDLTPYVGNNILLRFVNINDFSNSTFIDDIRVETTLSLGENTLEKAITMYPNPATNNVDIAINTTIGNTYEIELLNSIGQTITKINETRFSASAQQKLDVSGFDTGLYFVKIKVGDQVVTKKLIVN